MKVDTSSHNAITPAVVQDKQWQLSKAAAAVGQVLSIDGRSTDGWDGDRAATFLRGRSGSSVTVKFARRSLQIPGVAGRPELPPRVDYQQV